MKDIEVDETKNFDFVFSFAGEDRRIVEEIYNLLSGWGYRVFYDNAYQSTLMGQDLYHYLRELYRTKGKYVVCFVSQYYTRKAWTALEFSAIRERLMATFFASDFLLPIQIGSTEMLEDIPRFIGFYHHKTARQTAEILREKYQQSFSKRTPANNYALFIDDLLNRTIAYLLDVINLEATRDGQAGLIINNMNFILTTDVFSEFSGIIVWKQDEDMKDVPSTTTLPSAIITWQQHDRLLFSLYPFCMLIDNMEENITWDHIAQRFGDFIRGCIHE